MLRRFVESCKQVIKWLPVVWKQRDWDYAFTYELLRAKVSFIKRHYEKETEIGYVGMERDIEYMNILLNLLDEIIEDDYGVTDYDFENLADELVNQVFNKVDKREKKVKRLFWKIMENKLELFWI